MDASDRKILALLVEDGRRTYDDIGRRVSLSAPAVKRRVDRLRAQGALRGFTAVLDHAALGAGTQALVELFYAPGTLLDRVADSLRSHPGDVEAGGGPRDAHPEPPRRPAGKAPPGPPVHDPQRRRAA